MTNEQALAWIRQVRGQLYKSGESESGLETWVAVVRTPGRGTQTGKLIIALGESLLEATEAAEEQWQRLWTAMGETH